jgi:hypothetical protein
MVESASIILKVDNGPAKKTAGMLFSLQPMPFLDKSFSYESEVKKEIGIELVWKDNSELPPCVKGKVVVPRYQRYMVQNAVAQTVPIPKPRTKQFSLSIEIQLSSSYQTEWIPGF